jgi:hypothetical protein
LDISFIISLRDHLFDNAFIIVSQDHLMYMFSDSHNCNLLHMAHI